MERKLKGFTLVELVITIAIVIILSVISVPIYRGYVNKAIMSEGYALLGQILSAQKAYFSEYGNFLREQEMSGVWTCNETVLGIDARGNKYFTWMQPGDPGDEKFYFQAYIPKPEEAISNEFKYLSMWYNITTGVTIREIKG